MFFFKVIDVSTARHTIHIISTFNNIKSKGANSMSLEGVINRNGGTPNFWVWIYPMCAKSPNWLCILYPHYVCDLVRSEFKLCRTVRLQLTSSCLFSDVTYFIESSISPVAYAGFCNRGEANHSQLGGLGERCRLPQWGPERSPGSQRFSCA